MSSILTEQLPIGLAEWIKQNIYYEGMIVTVNDYPRLDNPVLEMTTCNVWLNNMDFKTKVGWVVGLINVDLIFNLNKARSDRFKQINEVVNGFTAQLLCNPTLALNWIATNYVAGLQFLVTKTTINFRDIINQLKDGRGDTTINIQLAYEVNIRQNQKALWAKGNDFWSPKEKVYHPIEYDTKIIVEAQTPNLPDLNTINKTKEEQNDN